MSNLLAVLTPFLLLAIGVAHLNASSIPQKILAAVAAVVGLMGVLNVAVMVASS